MAHDAQKPNLELETYWKHTTPKKYLTKKAPSRFAQLRTSTSSLTCAFSQLFCLLRHKRAQALLSLHNKMYDARFQKLLFTHAFENMGNHTVRPFACDSLTSTKHVPVKVIEWSMQALPRIPHGMYFVDFDSGYGQRLLIASSFEFERIIGCEASGEVCDYAQTNLSKFPRHLMGCRQVECMCVPASKVAIPDKNTAFMFYQPRGLADFKQQLGRIVTAYRAKPRQFYIITVDAHQRHHDLILESDIFEVKKYSWLARTKHMLLSPYKLRAYRTIGEYAPHQAQAMSYNI